MTYNGTVIREIKEKWEKVLNEEIQYTTVETAFIDLTKSKESAYQKYLQFKLLHSRTAINEKLFSMNLSNTQICPLCETHNESILHAFIECSYTIALWNEVEK